MIKKFLVEVDIDLDDYETNYGTRNETEATDYTTALLVETLNERFDTVGGWASLVGNEVTVL